MICALRLGFAELRRASGTSRYHQILDKIKKALGPVGVRPKAQEWRWAQSSQEKYRALVVRALRLCVANSSAIRFLVLLMILGPKPKAYPLSRPDLVLAEISKPHRKAVFAGGVPRDGCRGAAKLGRQCARR